MSVPKKSLALWRLRFGLLALVIIGITAGAFNGTSQTIHRAEFGNVSLRIEYALSDSERAKGLGDRAGIPEDYGMLFVFPRPARYGFWMKDTLIPLDIFWLDGKGQVVSMSEGVATSSYPNVFYPTAEALYVLETNAGVASHYGIATSTQLKLKSFPSVSK